MSFSTNICLYLYLLLKVEIPGLFSGKSPPKISFTYILATRFGESFRESSVISKPRVCIISANFSSIIFIFSSGDFSKASSLRGVWSLPVKTSSSLSIKLLIIEFKNTKILKYFLIL